MSETTRTVSLAREEGRGMIHLARDRGNAINDRVLDDMMEVLDQAETDPGIQGVILTAGGKMFSPGLDLHYLARLDREGIRRFMAKFSALNLKLFTFPKPMVAALSGHALAGGLILTLSADWRILRPGALVGLNELLVGVPLPFGVSLILRDAVSGPRLEEVALFGRNYEGEEAVRTGLVHELCEPERLPELARERLDEMTSKDLRSFAVTKRYLRSATVERIQAQDDARLDDFVHCWFSDGTQARIRGIVEYLSKKGS